MSYFVVPKSFAGPGPGGIFVDFFRDGSALSRILGQPTASCLHHWDIFGIQMDTVMFGILIVIIGT